MKIKLQIKSVLGKVLFEFEKENNAIKDTLLEAIIRGADLSGADLSGADLRAANLSDANLRGADLRGANLSGADLRAANLSDADLSDANLRAANLSDANLSGADLRAANLSDANLSDANLSDANLRAANLSDANLSGADLRASNLRGADLRGADANESTPFFFSQCPDGEFIGWKKAEENIVKLLITEDAKRSSATSLKCRCSKAKVLEIQGLDGSKSDVLEIASSYDTSFIYKIGETVEVPNYDTDRWNECSTGIHFFISRDMAVKYD